MQALQERLGRLSTRHTSAPAERGRTVKLWLTKECGGLRRVLKWLAIDAHLVPLRSIRRLYRVVVGCACYSRPPPSPGEYRLISEHAACRMPTTSKLDAASSACSGLGQPRGACCRRALVRQLSELRLGKVLFGLALFARAAADEAAAQQVRTVVSTTGRRDAVQRWTTALRKSKLGSR